MKKAILSALLCTAALQGAEHVKQGVEGLSEGIRSLLSQEMLQIEQGMNAMLSEIVRGDYDAVAVTATDIQDSFIFKKSLTDAQRKELKGALPPEFIALDRSFHETAGALAAAAEFGEKVKAVNLYADMMHKCVQCHTTFATYKFTGAEE